MRRLLCWPIIVAAVMLGMISAPSLLAKRTPRAKPNTSWRLNAFLAPGMRTNVFKAPSTFPQKDDNVNAGGIKLELNQRLSPKIQLAASTDADAELYATYSRRNQTNFGSDVETEWRPNRNWRLRIQGSVHRTTRDLIDDSGEFGGRTLAKWVSDISPELQWLRRGWRATATYVRSFTNYDESVDSVGVKLKSYDYDEHSLQLDLRFEISGHWQLRIDHELDWRDYKERKTLSINKRSSRPRKFSQWTIEPQLSYSGATISPYIRYSFTRRTDAFENFYGYDHAKYKIGADVKPSRRLKAEILFEYEDKDYPNYWTSRIGTAHRVSIQYRDWQLAMKYKLLQQLTMISNARWYVKSSNDRNFRYRQFSLFLGCELEIGTTERR